MGLKRLTNPVILKQLQNCKGVRGKMSFQGSAIYQIQTITDIYLEKEKKKTTELWVKQWESLAFLPGLATCPVPVRRVRYFLLSGWLAMKTSTFPVGDGGLYLEWRLGQISPSSKRETPRALPV